MHAYDGRETAPANVDANLFMREGKPLSFPRALVGGRSVGVPGALRMLELAHATYGRLPWRDAFSDASRLARDGFRVSARLSKLLALDPVLPTLTAARATLLDGQGRAPRAGSKRINRACASVLAKVAERGADALHTGAVAHDIVRAVHEAKQPSLSRGVWNLMLGELGLPMRGSADTRAPGELSARDLADYRPLVREPLCVSYRVCKPAD